jgi:hypothetical protein
MYNANRPFDASVNNKLLKAKNFMQKRNSILFELSFKIEGRTERYVNFIHQFRNISGLYYKIISMIVSDDRK